MSVEVPGAQHNYSYLANMINRVPVTYRHEAAGSMSESGIESMLDGLSWAEQMELEEQLAEAQGTYVTHTQGVAAWTNIYEDTKP